MRLVSSKAALEAFVAPKELYRGAGRFAVFEKPVGPIVPYPAIRDAYCVDLEIVPSDVSQAISREPAILVPMAIAHELFPLVFGCSTDDHPAIERIWELDEHTFSGEVRVIRKLKSYLVKDDLDVGIADEIWSEGIDSVLRELKDLFAGEINPKLSDPFALEGMLDGRLEVATGDVVEFLDLLRDVLEARMGKIGRAGLSVTTDFLEGGKDEDEYEDDDENYEFSVTPEALDDDVTAGLVRALFLVYRPTGQGFEYNDGAHDRMSGYDDVAFEIEIDVVAPSALTRTEAIVNLKTFVARHFADDPETLALAERLGE